MRWVSHEVGLTQGGSHVRWVMRGGLHEVGLTRDGSHARWVSCEVGYVR